MLSSLPSLPISFLTAAVALVLALLVVRSRAGTPGSRRCFALLFGVFALQALLVGLRFGYGVEALAPFQRALPFAVGPLTYLGFRAMAAPEVLQGRAPRVHAAAAGLAILACWLAPAVIDPQALPPLALGIVDLLIAGSFLVYLVLMIRLYRRGPDHFEAAGFGEVAQTRAWLLAAIALLAAMAALDGAIAVDFVAAAGRHAGGLIALGSAAIIPVLLAAAVFYPLRAASPSAATAQAQDSDAEADRALIARLETLLESHKLHHDPDLSLSRLARRLSVPSRRVSEAVNRQRGENVSQFVNRRRVEDAAALLLQSDRPAADVMLEAGFRTKSNFNREFRRITGRTPGEYRRQGRDTLRTA